MEPDDKVRGSIGVVASLLVTDAGKVRITLDDVKNDSGRPTTWKHRAFVTSKSYERSAIDNLDLPEDEFAALGHYLLARLNALRG